MTLEEGGRGMRPTKYDLKYRCVSKLCFYSFWDLKSLVIHQETFFLICFSVHSMKVLINGYFYTCHTGGEGTEK